MNQLEALYVAVGALEQLANLGNDECSEASGKLNEIIHSYHRKKANRGVRKKAIGLALNKSKHIIPNTAEPNIRSAD